MQGVTGEPQNDRSLQTCKLLQPVSLFKTVLQKPDEGRHHATDKANCNISVINPLRTVMMQPSTTRLDPASFSPVCMPVVGSVGILHALKADVQVIRGVKPVVEGQMPLLFGVAIRPHLMKPTTRHVQHLSSFQLALQASALCRKEGKLLPDVPFCLRKIHSTEAWRIAVINNCLPVDTTWSCIMICFTAFAI